MIAAAPGEPRIPDATGRLITLDLLRGLAALLVLVGHARAMVLLDAGQQSLPLAAYPFYLATSLGHQAVIVFFALSGYLVGGPAIARIGTDAFSFRGYWSRRLSRLLTVVVPALAVTFLADRISTALAGGAFYEGALFGAVSAGPSPAQPAQYGIDVLLGNVAFLQTIAVPVYGSNGPLWSLANEFWYYALGPLLFVALLSPGRRWRRFAAGAACLAIAVLLPVPLVLLGAIWLAGAAAAHLAPAARWTSLPAVLLALSAMAVTAAASRFGPEPWGDLALGLAVALALPVLALGPQPGGIMRRAGVGLSEVSFSLYAYHFPLLALFWLALADGRQWAFGPEGLAWFSLIAILAFVVSALLWWLTERNTPAVRRAFDAVLSGASAPRRAGGSAL